MSLKAFHVFFIVLSILLAAGCAVWSFANGVSVAFGGGCAAVAAALMIYGMFFIKKAKRIIT
jgi:hypothetical protein